MRILLDEMLSADIAVQLRERGYDIRATTENSGLRGLPDPELFAHAQREERAIVTYNREDFLALDREFRDLGREHHGIVILHPRRFPQGGAAVAALLAALAAFAETDGPYPGFVHWLQ